MKTFKSILIILVGIPLAVAVFQVVNKKPSVEVPVNPNIVNGVDLSPNITAKQVCYIWNTEAGDKAQLSMDIRGEKVVGEFNWLPKEKDKKTGIFTGNVISLSSGINKYGVSALWDTMGEGMNVKEELTIIFDDAIAKPGFGEMKDRGDGVYVYANPDKVSYDLNLQKTDCGDSAMD